MPGYLRKTKEAAKLRGGGHLVVFVFSGNFSLRGRDTRRIGQVKDVAGAAAGSLSLSLSFREGQSELLLGEGNSLLPPEHNPELLLLPWGSLCFWNVKNAFTLLWNFNKFNKGQWETRTVKQRLGQVHLGTWPRARHHLQGNPLNTFSFTSACCIFIDCYAYPYFSINYFPYSRNYLTWPLLGPQLFRAVLGVSWLWFWLLYHFQFGPWPIFLLSADADSWHINSRVLMTCALDVILTKQNTHSYLYKLCYSYV